MENCIKIQPNQTKINLNNIEQTIIQPIFKNQDVYVVGGGASLENFNFNRLKNKNVIAINKAFYSIPFCNVLYFSDNRFYMWYKNDIEKLNCLKYTIANQVKDKNITILKNTGKYGLDTKNGCIKHGGNSGYAALNLAYHLGAKRIILLGYDMKIINNKTHFHDGYITKQKNDIYKNFIEPFNYLLHEFNNLKIEVFNTSPNSDLNYFKKVSIDNFI